MATSTGSLPPGIYPIDGSPDRMAYWNGTDSDERPLASVGIRVAVNLVDLLIVSVLWFVLLIPIVLLDSSISGNGGSASGLGTILAFVVAPFVAMVGYFALMYRYVGRSLGLMLAGLYLVHIPTGSTRLPWAAALVRAVVLYVAYVMCFTVIVWLLITALSKTRQGPHDRLARTGVLKGAPPRPAIAVSIGAAPPAPRAAPSAPPPTPPAPPMVPAEPVMSSPGPVTAHQAAVPTIFISHATKDASVAMGLSEALEAEGVHTWIASRDVAVGANYAAEIVRAVRAADYLLVLLSPAGIDSPHVRREVSIAIDAKIPVLPVSTDPTGEFMVDLPVDWTYWLSLAQILRMSSEQKTAQEIARRISRSS